MKTPAWPFITIRHIYVASQYPEIFDKILDIAHKHPGACDEVWLCAPSYASRETLLQALPPLTRFQAKCDDYGIMLSFQQGVTLGHRPDPALAQNRPDFFPFEKDDFACDETGTRLYGQLCPRSPNVQRFAYEYAKTVLEILKPSSYWLDDDLRLGVSKPDECFCDRCLAEFNRQNHASYTRQVLTDRLFGETTIEPLRGQWAAFNAEAIALYAAQSRRAADDLQSDCRLAYQSVWANKFYCANNYRPLLEALAGKERKPVGIRPGALFFNEDNPRNMTFKSLSVAREAARCKRYGFVASICYEQETYPRKVLQKSPEAIMVESTLALASGCNSLSEYYYSADNHEPLEYYEDFSHELSLWRPYLELVAASTKRTRLAGLARFLGSNAFNHHSFNLDDESEEFLAEFGVPITVEEDEPDAYLVTPKTVEYLTAEDFPRLFAKPVLIPADAFDLLTKQFPQELAKFAPDAALANAALATAIQQAKLVKLANGKLVMPDQPVSEEIEPPALKYGAVVADTTLGTKFAVIQPLVQFPTAYARQAILDALDAISGQKFPVRLDTCQAVRILPHVNGRGKVDSVTLLNMSIGRTRELTLQVRCPNTTKPLLAKPIAQPVPATCAYDTASDNLTISVPRIPAWKPVTLIFE
ncbi:MAG: hypothetical protein J6866_03360 [Victivallales bacterium]|nr:hypothetical protein [Victivallales bacterium]